MNKWADYLISEIHYDNEHTRINEVKTRQHLETGISNNIIRKTRLEVVSDLSNGRTYKTIFHDKTKNLWNRGEDVRVKDVGNNKFITTDPNETTRDNLGDLPEY